MHSEKLLCFCDEVVKFSVFSKVRAERHLYWQFVWFASLWKFMKRVKHFLAHTGVL